MAEIYRFLGIVITMYPDADHNPPHIHARYAEFDAKINIKTLAIISGYLPNKKVMLVREFIEYHKEELMKMWLEKKTYRLED